MFRFISACFFLCSLIATDATYKFIFDAGSSGVKIALFACGGAVCPTASVVSGKTKCGSMKVATLNQLAASAHALHAFQDLLNEIETNSGVETRASFISATAGNRIINPAADRDTWRDTLAATHYGSERTIDGRTEAMYEFIASNFYSEAVGASSFWTKGWKSIISLGGASAQIAVDLKAPKALRAFVGFLSIVFDPENFRPACENQRYTNNYFGVAKIDKTTLRPEFLEYPDTETTFDGVLEVYKEFCKGERCVGAISFLAGHTERFCGRQTGLLITAINAVALEVEDEISKRKAKEMHAEGGKHGGDQSKISEEREAELGLAAQTYVQMNLKNMYGTIYEKLVSHVFGGFAQMKALVDTAKPSNKEEFFRKAMLADILAEPIISLMYDLVVDAGINEWYAAGSFANVLDDSKAYIKDFGRAYLSVLFYAVQRVNYGTKTLKSLGRYSTVTLLPADHSDWAFAIATRYSCSQCSIFVPTLPVDADSKPKCNILEGGEALGKGRWESTEAVYSTYKAALWNFSGMLEELDVAISQLL